MSFLFITITLMILVAISFWMDVPKASAPLFIIYIIFAFTKESPTDIDTDQVKIIRDEFQNDSESLSDMKVKDQNLITEKPKKSIDPKPLVFKNDPKQNNKKSKKELRSDSKEIVKEPSKSKKDKKPVYELVVKDIKICKNIYKRTPVGSDVIFTNNVDSLYCYTRIQNTGPKREVKHVWYFNNQVMTQVRYNVKKSNIYRSWTKKTILRSQVGNWRVEILDNHGTLIGSKKFKIKDISDYN